MILAWSLRIMRPQPLLSHHHRWACRGRPSHLRGEEPGGHYVDAQVTFVCHSMGGLVARWHIEHCGGAEYTRRLITLGTPYRGAAKALEQLVNGVHTGIGPFAIDLTQFARSLPSMHQLLPEYACITNGDDLVKTTNIDLPELKGKKVADGMLFHTQLARAEARRPDSLTHTHAIVGIHQPTPTTASLTRGRVTLHETYQTENLFGDATVPIVAACRSDVPMDSNMLRRVPDRHGNLQRNQAALDELEGILTARRIVVRASNAVDLRVEAPDTVLAGEDLAVNVSTVDASRHAIRVTVTNEAGRYVDGRLLKPGAGTSTATIDGLSPGAYTIDITGIDDASPIGPVSSDVLVWDPDLSR